MLKDLENKHCKQREAALRLELSVRQVQRLVSAYKGKGDEAVVHGLAGSGSNRKIDEEIQKRAGQQPALTRRRRTWICEKWVSEHGRPMACYTDKAGLFQTAVFRHGTRPAGEGDAIGQDQHAGTGAAIP